MINVKNRIKIHEVNGDKLKIGSEQPSLFVESHSSHETMVIVEFEGKKLTVSAIDLISAIRNAQNSNHYGY